MEFIIDDGGGPGIEAIRETVLGKLGAALTAEIGAAGFIMRGVGPELHLMVRAAVLHPEWVMAVEQEIWGVLDDEARRQLDVTVNSMVELYPVGGVSDGDA